LELFDIWPHDLRSAQFGYMQALLSDVNKEISAKELGTTYKDQLAQISKECEALGLDSVADLAGWILHELNRDDVKMTVGEFITRLRDLDFLFKTQASKQVFFRLNREESEMFRNEKPFGVEVAQAFPSTETIFEQVEAVKCLALGRYTATVFHLMRVLEKGLKALASNLNVQFSIPFDYQNWQNIIEQIEKEIGRLALQPKGQQKTDDLKVYSEIAQQFRYFKDAWRNNVAHSRETYSPEQALSIMRHVREFMQDITKMGLKETP